MKASLSVFFLSRFDFLHSDKSLLKPRLQRILSIFSSINFIVLGFTFRSVFHFKLIFVGFYAYGCPLLSFFEKDFLSLLNYLVTFVKVSQWYTCGSIFGLSLLFHRPICLSPVIVYFKRRNICVFYIVLTYEIQIMQ